MNKRGLSAIFSMFLLFFYIAIVVYVFFAVLHVNELQNFLAAMLFEGIGFVILFVLIVGNIVTRGISTGYFVPIVMVTVIYTIILDVVNMALLLIPNVYFVLINLVLLFVYCIVSIPMYIMGKKIIKM